MTNRATLKTYFAAGALPTQEHFEELIESTLNMQDEGFKRTAAHGVEIAKLRDQTAFISFYGSTDASLPDWSVSSDGGNRLLFRAGAARQADQQPVLCLHTQNLGSATEPQLGARVGIGMQAPQSELDVAGTVRMRARQGAFVPAAHRAPEGGLNEEGIKAAQSIRADGNWHDLTGPLTGCHGFEIMAGTGSRDQGRYALLHAVALNAFHPRIWPFALFNTRRPIRCTEAFYERRCDRLQLQWVSRNGKYGRDAEYGLQIRSACAYPVGIDGKSPPIRCHITQLWTDPTMEDLLV